MFRIENTENLTGVTISGDFYDLSHLVEAFYSITIGEEDEKNYRFYDISTRVLGLCYDIRHAMQGDRNISLIDNGMNEETMVYQSKITPRHNVYFHCNYIYPEMFFVTLALNDLAKLYINSNCKPKNDYHGALNKAVIWDENLAVIRCFQAAFNKCVKETLTGATYSRWLNLMNSGFIETTGICGQFIDYHNIQYLKMSREQRLKKLSTIAKRIAEYYKDPIHRDLAETLKEAAAQHNCSVSDLRMPELEYPEEIIW